MPAPTTHTSAWVLPVRAGNETSGIFHGESLFPESPLIIGMALNSFRRVDPKGGGREGAKALPSLGGLGKELLVFVLPGAELFLGFILGEAVFFLQLAQQPVLLAF